MSVGEISVVVPVRDGADGLRTLLPALEAQTLRSFEVIVVDNASSDESAAVARAAGATVVAEPVPGRARARNAGAVAATAPKLAFVDADCVADPEWLTALNGCLDDYAVVAGRVRLVTGASPNHVERLEALWRFDQERTVRDAGWGASANLGFRRDVFDALGGFDVSYRHIGEDVDLCVRAARAGHELSYCASAVVAHPAEREVVTILRRAFVHGWSSNQHYHRLGSLIGYRHWRHPRPALRGDWALRRWASPESLSLGDRRSLLRLARAEYAARVAGSAWAELRRAR